MDNFQLSPVEIATLKTFHRTLRDRRLADRIKAVVLLGSGWSVAEVAQALLIDESTVYHWLEKYQHGGKDALLTLCYSGKACSLTEKQQKELAKHLDENTYRTSKEIRLYIQKTFRRRIM